MRRWVKRCVALLLIALLVGGIAYIAATETAVDGLLRPRNPDEPDRTVPEDVDHQLRVSRPDGVTLDVWVLEAEAPKPAGAVDTALVLHGISDQKRTMLSLARRFTQHGVRVILVDLRGHGLSTETNITFGVREREDLRAVLDAVEERLSVDGGSLGEVGVYGPSYGGAVAIQLAGVEPRVKRVVTVAAFASMQRIMRPYVRTSFGDYGEYVPDVVAGFMVTRAGSRGGFDPDEASPERLVADAEARLLVVHSPQDEIVPYAHAVAIVDNCGGRCELLTLEGKTHLESLSNIELRRALHMFLVGEEWTGG